jgi:hypothetical protein
VIPSNRAKIWLAILALAALAMMLVGIRANATPVTLTWTAVGDDSTSGTASQYDLRYKIIAPAVGDTASWWSSATQVTGEPAPLVAGTTQSWTGDVVPGTYYWIIRSADEVPNWSGWSNVATKVVADVTAPFRIYDLR